MNTKSYPITARIDSSINPKDGIPEAILEQSPWHWNPQETDHNDGESFMFQSEDLDWTELKTGQFIVLMK